MKKIAPTKVTVCITTYKHEAFIADALDSILNQKTNFTFDLIIGIDPPFDGAINIIKKYEALHPDKITLIARPENVGAAFNLIDTCDQARGEYIAILDGDDIMLPTKLQKQADYLDQNRDVVMVGHAMRVFDHASGNTIKIEKPQKIKNTYTIEDFLTLGSFLPNSSKMFRRDAWPTDLKKYTLKQIGDYYFTLHVVKNNKAVYSPEVLGEYRMHGKNLTRTMNGADIHDDMKTTLDSVSNRYNKKYDHLFGHITAYGKMLHGIDEIRKGNIKTGRSLLFGSMIAKWNIAKSPYYYLFLSFLPGSIRHYFVK